jgi:hypothetical protein
MSENTNVNATDNVTSVVTPDQGELQGVPSAAEVKEIERANRRDRLSAKVKAKEARDKEVKAKATAKGKAESKGKAKSTPEPTPVNDKPLLRSLKIKDGRIVNVKEIFAATNNGKPYAMSKFILRLLNAILGRKWTRKVGEGMGDGLEYHWILTSKEEGTVALQHATDAARALGYKLGTGNGDGDGCVLVEPDGKGNAKQQRLVFAY